MLNMDQFIQGRRGCNNAENKIDIHTASRFNPFLSLQLYVQSILTNTNLFLIVECKKNIVSYCINIACKKQIVSPEIPHYFISKTGCMICVKSVLCCPFIFYSLIIRAF